jgi:hypothetical protein
MFRLSFIFALLLSAICVIAEVPTNGLIAAYTFNSAGNPYRDVSGNGHDLTVVDPANAPDTVSDLVSMSGNRHRVIYFEPNNRFVSALSATIPTLPKGEESRTIVFYIKIPTTSFKGYNGVVFSYGSTQNVLSILDTNTAASPSPFYLTFSYFLKGYPSTGFSNYASQTDYSAVNDVVSGWTFVIAKYDYSTGKATLKVGSLGSSTKTLTCPNPEALGPFLLGGGTQGFEGYIDDIYIYNRALSTDELNVVKIEAGTLDIPTSITPTHITPTVKRAVQGKAMYTIAGRQATKTRGILVSKGVARLVVR